MADQSGTIIGVDAFKSTLEVAVRIGLVLLVLWWCLNICRPFIEIIVWGMIIAVAVYPIYRKLESAMGGKSGMAATLFTVVAVGILVVPAVLLLDSLIDASRDLATGLKDGTLAVHPPPDEVASWPVIGKPLYQVWQSASVNLADTLSRYHAQLGQIGGKILSAIAGAGFGVFQFTISLIIAGVFLAKTTGARNAAVTMFSRVLGEQGEAFVEISKTTIRSVAQGVLGVAVVQTLMCALGMVVVGVPGVGLWSFIVLVLAVVQLPPILIMGPIIIYMFSKLSTGSAVAFAIYGAVAAGSDTWLKPMFLGRGTKSPMLVILIGAIGGMILMGIIGLFLGAVVLAIGYELFLEWLQESSGEQVTDHSV
jgi:predicted PurR-regulated permease PerM